MFNIFEVTIYVRSLRKVFGNSSEHRKKMVGVADASMRVPRPCHPAQSCEPQAATWREARGRGGSFCSRALPNPPAASRGQELPFFSLARQRCVPTPSSLQLQPSRRAPAAPRAPAHRSRQEGRARSNRPDLPPDETRCEGTGAAVVARSLAVLDRMTILFGFGASSAPHPCGEAKRRLLGEQTSNWLVDCLTRIFLCLPWMFFFC